MNRQHATVLGSALCAVVLLTRPFLTATRSSGIANQGLRFRVTDLGDLGDPPEVNAINERGHCVGKIIKTKGDPHALIRAAMYDGKHWLDVGAVGDSRATDINNQDVAVGYELTDAVRGAHRSFLWKGGRKHIIEALAHIRSEAYGINQNGDIVGEAYFPGHLQNPCAFRLKDGKLLNLGSLAGGFRYSQATAINDRGWIVGYSSRSQGDIGAFLWTNGRMRSLSKPDEIATVSGINAAGWVVVNYSKPFSPSKLNILLGPLAITDGTFLWHAGKRTVIAPPVFGRQVEMAAINDARDVVGTAKVLMLDGRPVRESETDVTQENVSKIRRQTSAMLWRNGRLMDLNSLIPANSGWHLERASAINNKGQIAGSGYHYGKPRAFLLGPISIGSVKGNR